jgi:hypothetical protein
MAWTDLSLRFSGALSLGLTAMIETGRFAAGLRSSASRLRKVIQSQNTDLLRRRPHN